MNLVQSAADYSGWFIQVKHIILIDKKERYRIRVNAANTHCSKQANYSREKTIFEIGCFFF